MTLDLDLVLKALGSVLLVGLGALLNHILERRPRLAAYYGSVGAFQLPPTTPGDMPTHVHTHTIVLKNAGRLAAHNIRVPHAGRLAAADIHVSVYPPVPNSTEVMPGGQEVIVLPLLAPGQQVTLSYLYFPPVTFDRINLPISSDEGMARVLNVLPTPQLRWWWVLVLRGLVLIGIAAVLYGLFQLYRWWMP